MNDQRPRIGSHLTWVTLFFNLVILLCLAWFLYAPLRPSYEQLAAIRLGMPLDEAQRRLAPARELTGHTLEIIPVFTPPGDPKTSVARGNLGVVTSARLHFTPASVLQPKLVAEVDTSWIVGQVREEIGDGPGGRNQHLWLGRDHLLWVQVDERGVINWIRLIPIREEGGGVMAWIKHQYQAWFGRPSPPVTITAPAPSAE